MTRSVWWLVAAVVGGVLVLWMALVVTLSCASKSGVRAGEVLRLLPDVLRAASSLAR